MSGADRLFDAITEVRGDYIDAAGDCRFVRRRTLPAAWRQYAAVAACLALIVGGVFALSQVRMGGSDGGNGWSGSADNGGGAAGGGWNGSTASPPGSAEPGDAAPPTGPAGEDPPSGEGSYGSEVPAALAQKIPALTAEGETEHVTAARTLTLTFSEDHRIVRAEDRYVLTNTGAEGCTVTLRCDGVELVDWSGDMEMEWEYEDNIGRGRLVLPAGCTAEWVLESAVVPVDGVLTVEEPQGFAVTESTVTIVNRQWMEERGITVMLGGEGIDP